MLLIQLIKYGFSLYRVLLMTRLIGSWFPTIYSYPWFIFVCQITDPYLDLFRRLIPPIGGTLDLSPMLAWFLLSLLESLLLSLFLCR
ncbi:YggT family protein [Rhabdochlamydiaceae symbiont of Dictyostelium giganteum]|uniref:YggT family protein n=1 Tax=Rhabdochlamydiaceae symbiont of Dictyostelium giganteum TaxID=3342349 RepID=UPI00384C8663